MRAGWLERTRCCSSWERNVRTQAITIPLYVSATKEPSVVPVPPGSNLSEAFTLDDFSWERVWTYRRVVAVNHSFGTLFDVALAALSSTVSQIRRTSAR